MKKGRLAVTLAAVMGLTCSAVALVACGGPTPDEGENNHIVTFDYNDGGATAATQVTVADGEKVAKPNDPTRTSYVFDGWYNGTTAYDFDAAVTADLTLKANWLLEVSVTYVIPDEYGDATAPAVQKVGAGKTVTVAAAPEIDGYVFVNWDDGSVDVAAGSTLTVDEDITLTASYVEAVYINLYDGFGTEPCASVPVGKGMNADLSALPEAPAHAGFKNGKWVTEGVKLTAMTADVDVYASYESDYFDFEEVLDDDDTTVKGYAISAKEEQPAEVLDSVTIPMLWQNKAVVIAEGEFEEDADGELDDITYSPLGALKAKNVTIPDSITDIPVCAFAGNESIATITFPAELKTIGAYSFADSTLVGIIVPKTVTSIGKGAFYYVSQPDWDDDADNTDKVSALKSVIFESGIQLETIPQNCFRGAGLSLIHIPASVKTIGDCAFGYEAALKNITIATDSQIQTIGSNAFADSAIVGIVIPKTVTTIGAGAFNQVSALTSVTFESGIQLETIPDDCFRGTGITSIEIPTSVETIGSNAFAGSALAAIEISKTIATIGSGAFYQASELKSVTFASDIMLETIPEDCFCGAGITAIEIPASVETIGDSAFKTTAALKNITFATGCDLKTIGAYAFADSAIVGIVIPSSVTTIGNGAFYYISQPGWANSYDNTDKVSALKSVIFESGIQLETIPEDCFCGAGITSIQIPASVKTIGDWAFGYAAALKTVTFETGSNLETIGESAFDCADGQYTNKNRSGSIEEIDLSGTKVISIGENAFARQCLGKIVLSNYVQTIGDFAFKRGRDYQENELPTSKNPSYEYGTLTIPASLRSIGRNVFQHRRFTEIIFASNSALTTINNYAFANITNLSKIKNIPKTVTDIGEHAFDGSNSLTEITFEDNGTENLTIGANAFQAGTDNAENRMSVILPSRVTSIGNYAFANFKGIKSITITSATAPTVEAKTFNSCADSFTVYFSALPSDANWQAHMSRVAVKNQGATELADDYVGVSYEMPASLAGVTVAINARAESKYAYNNVKVKLPAAQTFNGYTFSGWKIKDTETVYNDGAEIDVTSKVVLVPQYVAKTFNIKFVMPNKEQLMGYYTYDDGGVTKNNVSDWDKSNEDVLKSVQVKFGETFDLSANDTPAFYANNKYKFLGAWYIPGVASAQTDATYTFQGNALSTTEDGAELLIYAQYGVKTSVEISLSADGGYDGQDNEGANAIGLNGATVNDQNVTNESVLYAGEKLSAKKPWTTTANPSPNPYVGWFTVYNKDDISKNKKFGSGNAPTSDIVVTSYDESTGESKMTLILVLGKNFTITYQMPEIDGFTPPNAPSAQTKLTNNYGTLANVNNKDGYTFTGWRDAEGNFYAKGVNYYFTEKMATLTAVFDPPAAA